jgi:hypothetical protein
MGGTDFCLLDVLGHLDRLGAADYPVAAAFQQHHRPEAVLLGHLLQLLADLAANHDLAHLLLVEQKRCLNHLPHLGERAVVGGARHADLGRAVEHRLDRLVLGVELPGVEYLHGDLAAREVGNALGKEIHRLARRLILRVRVGGSDLERRQIILRQDRRGNKRSGHEACERPEFPFAHR